MKKDIIEQICFNNDIWALDEAKSWIELNGFNPSYDIWAGYIRFKQHKKESKNFKLIHIGKGLTFIIGFY